MVEETAQKTGFDFEKHEFKEPTKTLVEVADVEKFKQSVGCKELIAFLNALMNGCKTTKMTKTDLTPVSSHYVVQ